jgi:hypothetical protein
MDIPPDLRERVIRRIKQGLNPIITEGDNDDGDDGIYDDDDYDNDDYDDDYDHETEDDNVYSDDSMAVDRHEDEGANHEIKNKIIQNINDNTATSQTNEGDRDGTNDPPPIEQGMTSDDISVASATPESSTAKPVSPTKNKWRINL